MSYFKRWADRIVRSLGSLTIAVAPVAISVPTAASAGVTDVGVVRTDEESPRSILSTLYGGAFEPVGDDLTNGAVTARRVPDAPAASADTAQTDQVWTLGRFSVRAAAKFSNYSQRLAIRRPDGSTADLFAADGYGYDSTGQGSLASGVTQGRFVRSGGTGAQSSLQADNPEQRDHLISYEIRGLPDAGQDERVWVMFWEDLDPALARVPGRTGRDYNDLAVELRASAAPADAASIPLPAGAWATAGVGVIAFATAAKQGRLRWPRPLGR